MSQSYDGLRDFLDHRMRMAHVYQPVMLEVLLANGGSASIREIATAFLAHDESQAEYYEQVVKKMPGPVLSRHGIVQRAGETYALTSDVAALTRDERETLMRRCREAVDAFKARRGATIWEHRRPRLGVIPGRVRYDTLKRAKFRCELCGISADERALDVDHILPSTTFRRSVGSATPTRARLTTPTSASSHRRTHTATRVACSALERTAPRSMRTSWPF